MKILNIIFLSILFVSAAMAQKPADPVAEYKANAQICRDQLQQDDSTKAEESCKGAIDLALALPDVNKAEKLSAYENYGLFFYFQEKHEEATENFLKALDYGKSMRAGSAEVGNLYFNLGRTYKALGKTTAARGYFVEAEKTYTLAARNTKSAAKKKEYRDIISVLRVLQKVDIY